MINTPFAISGDKLFKYSSDTQFLGLLAYRAQEGEGKSMTNPKGTVYEH